MGALLFCNQDILLLSPSFVLFSFRRFLWTWFVLWCLQSTGTRGISLKKSFAESWLHFVIERWRHVQGNHFLWPLSVPKCWESCRLWLGAAGLRAFLHLQHLMVCFSHVTRCPWKLNPFVHKFKKKEIQTLHSEGFVTLFETLPPWAPAHPLPRLWSSVLVWGGQKALPVRYPSSQTHSHRMPFCHH